MRTASAASCIVLSSCAWTAAAEAPSLPPPIATVSSGAASASIAVNAPAAALRFEHAFEPGPAVRAWQAAAMESVTNGTPRPEPLPVFRYLVRYVDGAELPVVVRWSEGVEGRRRRIFDPVSRFVGPMAWADVAREGPADAASGEREVRYAMRWPNPRPPVAIHSVIVQGLDHSDCGTAQIFAVEALNEPAAGRALFVAPGGDDDGPGTFERPWATPHKAAAEAKAGDTVYLRAGTYAVSRPVMPAHSGRDGAWIAFRNYPGESAILNGRAITSDRPGNDLAVDWDGAPAATIATRTGVFHILGRAYIRVQGLGIEDSGFAGISIDALPWWPVAGVSEGKDQPRIPPSHHIEILHNRVQRTTNVGIGVYGSIIPAYRCLEHVRAIGNLILRAHDKETLLAGSDPSQNKTRDEIRRRGKSKWGDESLDFHAVQHLEVAHNEVAFGGKEAVDLMNGTRHARVHHNYTHDQYFTMLSGGRVGIYLDGRSGQWDIEVDRNVCERNGSGIQANAEDGAPAHDIRIHHNLCRSNYWTGINVSVWTDDAKEIRDVRIENNVVVGNGFLESNRPPTGGIHIGSRTPSLRDVVVRGNVVADNRDYQIAHWQADLAAANIVIDGNRVWPAALRTFDNPDWAKRWVPTHGANAAIEEPFAEGIEVLGPP
jgi:hypothetical protein